MIIVRRNNKILKLLSAFAGIFIVFILILSGCSGKESKKLWKLEECEATEIFYQGEKLPCADVRECVLPFGREVVGSYCLYDFKVYYEVNYGNTLIDQTGMAPNIEFSEEYNTQIRCYDMENQTDMLIYQYNSAKCEDVIDIECNGTYLIWEKIDNNGWELNSIRLHENDNNVPEVITRLSEGEMQIVLFTLRDDEVFWYDYEDKKMNLYSYNLNTKEKNMLYEDCTLTSPYEAPCVVGDNIILYRTDEEGVTRIISINRKNGQELQIQVQSEMADIEADSDFYVWRKDYGADIELYFYDIAQEKYRKIECGDIFSYALQDQYLVLNLRNQEMWNGEGVYCIDLKENQAYYISGKDATTLWTYTGENYVYWQEVDSTNEFRIVDLVFNQ